MKKASAILAGITGAIVMSLIMAFARSLGLTAMNLEMTLGTLLISDLGVGTWILGLFMHLTAGAVFALIYARAFETVSHHADAKIGAWYGVLHTVFSGILMGFLPAIHPRVPELLPAPGWFAANFGLVTLVAFIALHVIYGSLVGGMYGPVGRKVQHMPYATRDKRRMAA